MYMDNCYNSYNLSQKFLEKKIYCTSTLPSANKLNKPKYLVTVKQFQGIVMIKRQEIRYIKEMLHKVCQFPNGMVLPPNPEVKKNESTTTKKLQYIYDYEQNQQASSNIVHIYKKMYSMA